MTDQTPIKDVDLRLRAEWVSTLCMAIENCHPQDSSLIMTEALAGSRFQRSPQGHADHGKQWSMSKASRFRRLPVQTQRIVSPRSRR
jgi:hypothetical protein